ncbi:MAG: NAD-dependent epimerase/dehydratase family protein [Anaerolineae bacterium]
MKILVTGGAGFIGANLVRQLLDAGHRVRVLDNFSVGRRAHLQGLPLEIIAGDILDVEAVAQAVQGVDGIVHLAAQTGVPGSLIDPHHDCRTNVLGTLNMLEAARHADVERFVFASSNAPLGRQPPPATEDKAPLPISPYGASKLAGEGYCLAYHGSWGLGTVVLRFANVYGPYSMHKSSVVAKFFKDILSKGEITIDGDGLQTRDFIYVGDLCRAVVLALESDVSGEVFQIATGVETSIRELAALVQDVMGRAVEAQYGPGRQGDIRKNYSAVGKVERVLGWVPQVSLGQGVQAMWAWFRPRAREWQCQVPK